MTLMTALSILTVLSALFSYINYRFLKLPTTIGVMLIAMLFSLLISFSPFAQADIKKVLEAIDFSGAVLNGMLSFLLFAGALHVDVVKLKEHRLMIFTMAFLGTLCSAFFIGYLVYFLLGLFGIQINILYALLFGALISPTDPIAVLAILKQAGIRQSLEIKVVGESLFNDGVAVVIFVVLLGILNTGEVEAVHVLEIFVREVLGGIILGAVLGAVVYFLIRKVDDYKLEVFLTLALVMGGYELAKAIEASGPIAMVVAGLIVGSVVGNKVMSEQTKKYVNGFWELIDEFLNVLLFLLIGLELLMIPFDKTVFLVGLITIPALLVVRYMTALVPVSIFGRFMDFDPGTVNILTWGGLRGGLSIALVLSLPSSEERNILLLVTYCVVIFSIIVQGLTIGKLARRYAD